MMNKTSWVGGNQIVRDWYIIDATDMPVGRLATVIAVYLAGKKKVNYVPNIDMGDFVVVINVDKMKFTGKKLEHKEYKRFSGYPSGLKKVPAKKLMKENPKKVLLHAVRGMLPKTSLRTNQLHRLKMYIGEEHPHNNVKLIKINI